MLFLSSFEACLYVAGLHFELPFVFGRFHIFAGKVNRLPSAGSLVFFVDLSLFWVSKATGSFWIRSGTKRPLTSLRRVVDASRFRQRERRVYSVGKPIVVLFSGAITFLRHTQHSFVREYREDLTRFFLLPPKLTTNMFRGRPSPSCACNNSTNISSSPRKGAEQRR